MRSARTSSLSPARLLLALALLTSIEPVAAAASKRFSADKAKAKLLASGRITASTPGIKEIRLDRNEIHFEDGAIGRFSSHRKEWSDDEPDAYVDIITPNRKTGRPLDLKTNGLRGTTSREFAIHEGKPFYHRTFKRFDNDATMSNAFTKDLRREGRNKTRQTRDARGRFVKVEADPKQP
jgi:hypothetical protein